MAGFFRRGGDQSNTITGIILLIVLLVFSGPNVLPIVLSRTLPFIYEGAPCGRLRTAENRAFHQSLIGRATTNPLTIRADASPIPQTNDGTLTITITIVNNTIGTVPIIFDPQQVIVGDAVNSSGVGLIFEPTSSIQTNGFRRTPGATTFVEADIRLLGPRQRCVHRVEFSGAQLDPVIRSGSARVRAYYRITGPGVIQPPAGGRAPIFQDQGLAIIPGGIILSEPALLAYQASAN